MLCLAWLLLLGYASSNVLAQKIQICLPRQSPFNPGQGDQSYPGGAGLPSGQQSNPPPRIIHFVNPQDDPGNPGAWIPVNNVDGIKYIPGNYPHYPQGAPGGPGQYPQYPYGQGGPGGPQGQPNQDGPTVIIFGNPDSRGRPGAPGPAGGCFVLDNSQARPRLVEIKCPRGPSHRLPRRDNHPGPLVIIAPQPRNAPQQPRTNIVQIIYVLGPLERHLIPYVPEDWDPIPNYPDFYLYLPIFDYLTAPYWLQFYPHPFYPMFYDATPFFPPTYNPYNAYAHQPSSQPTYQVIYGRKKRSAASDFVTSILHPGKHDKSKLKTTTVSPHHGNHHTTTTKSSHHHHKHTKDLKDKHKASKHHHTTVKPLHGIHKHNGTTAHGHTVAHLVTKSHLHTTTLKPHKIIKG